MNLIHENKLTEKSTAIAAILIDRGETICVAESSAGGLISASLLAVAGASSYFVGGGVIYTHKARKSFLPDAGDALSGIRSASEPYASWLAETLCGHLGTTWALAETGAAGPSGNSYGDKAGHSCFAVCGPRKSVVTIETNLTERQENMWLFTHAGLDLLRETVES